MKTFLHVGCGPKRKPQTTAAFNTKEWRELRLDIDEEASPDILGTMTDMALVGSESVQAIFSSHNIEHLYAHEVPQALSEFLRVLDDSGFVVLTCPDLQSICALVAGGGLAKPAYRSPAGPITPHDVIYGHGPHLARGKLYMAHRSGFSEQTLRTAFESAGFASIASLCRGKAPYFDLWLLATKRATAHDTLLSLARAHFPT